MPKLTSLNLSACNELEVVSMPAIARSCPDLETLFLRRLKIKEETPGDIAKSLPKLRILDLSYSRGILSHRELLKELGTCCPLLEELYVQGLSNYDLKSYGLEEVIA